MIDRDKEIAFIKDRSRWPNYPFQTMKRRKKGEAPEVGYLFASDSKPTIHHVNILDDNPDKHKNAKLTPYEGIGAMVDDGWVVD